MNKIEKVYLVNRETNELLRTFDNVDNYGENFVEYKNNGYRAKMYCEPNQLFTEDEPVVEEPEDVIEDGTESK